ncbi:MAG: hypothetical protein A2826_01705 [Candidatus Doudnabacteria bacterium RIFCSPHIGHO2_01_FULL_43_23]|uniref:Baseplate protein J-like domain-containing protein n=1 Tax=Candidatus Doudnabacteria bacterium RIFCSPHIGHO2_01_FULL_43_23 TaxID=1817822 RepID=A0A1F5NRN3_9BACT|nr:MAG: hypothetical protein A2826_01705 [Candidatus Doudnabacteria bacterium RIFCSPHIGHO2_01_FULL_43_23]
MKKLYLNFDEEVMSALQKIKKSGEDELVLVVPKGARIFRSTTALRLIRQQAAKLRKTIKVSTADERGKVLVKRAGIILATHTEEIPFAAVAQRQKRSIEDIRVTPRQIVKSEALKIDEDDAIKSRNKLTEPEEELSDLIGPGSSDSEIKIPKVIKVPLSSYRYTFISVFLILVAVLVIIFYILPSATVVVTARSEPLARDLEILVDSQTTVPDIQNLLVPGQRIEEERDYSGEYPATGSKKVGKPASGFVTIYNFSNNNLILRAATTRLEVEGKVYRLLQDVTRLAPTGKTPSGDIDPNTLVNPVPVSADDPGSDFNAPAGTRFEIINEVFGHQPEILYAQNANPVSGGNDDEVAIVSEQDIENARASTTVAVLALLEKQLSDKLGEEISLPPTAATVEVLDESISHKAGAEVSRFSLSQKLLIKALIYNKSDVKEIMKERIVRLLPENKTLVSSDEVIEAEFVSLDLSAGAGTLHAHYESSIIYKINEDFLKRSLKGKSITEAKEILLARPEIDQVDVLLSPFWVRKIPRFESKLTFNTSQ